MYNFKTTSKMTNFFLYLLILTLGLSCNSSGKESTTISQIIRTDNAGVKPHKNIRFDFSVGRINTFKESIEIKATLFNQNTDTVYFLSTTCDGEQYSLRYDTTKFVLTPFINCNARFPSIIKIAPNEKYDFIAHFRCSSKETKIKLGFDFYSVKKSFDVTTKNLEALTIFNRPKDKQTIIWAEEKTIE
jgi:hypothetical protein